jgi:cytochrome c oxidase subunit IV
LGATANVTPPEGETKRATKRPYFLVFVVLAVVTLVELNAYGFGLPQLGTIILLVVLATIKASLVVAYYMHLRYEPRWLGLIPLAGLALVAVLVAALVATVAQP